MLNAIFRPLEKWDRPKTQRRVKRFSVGYLKLLDDLERELRAIKAQDIVIQLALSRDQIRNDGWPRAGVNPSWPGVILSFLQAKDSISMPCDTFISWQQNLRAISLTLENLRRINEYGVTKNNEQYQGFKRLDAPDQETVRLAALTKLSELSGCGIGALRSQEAVDAAYRAAARRTHPDIAGANEEFLQLQAVMEVLRPRATGGAA